MPSEALNRAISAYQAGRFAKAERICKQLISAEHFLFDALHLLAVVQTSLGKNAEAVASYDRALAVRPDHPEALYNRGVALKELKRLDEAVASYDRALSVRPDYVEALNNRGIALKELNRHAEALASYDRALSLRPHDAKALYNRGNALKELKRYGEAVASYDRALVLRPDYAEALYNRGATLNALERYEEALASYDRALLARPGYAEAHNNRGIALRQLERLEEAVASFNRALSARPDYAEAHNNLGVTLEALKRLDQALASFDRALATRPNYADALNNRGNVLNALGRYDEAIDSYGRALSLRPDYINALHNMGVILRELGRTEQARDHIERAIRLSPRTPELYLALAGSNKLAAGDPHLVAMQELAQDMSSLNADEQIALHFAMGKALSDIGQNEQSFRHLIQGNALKRRQIAYDELAMLGLFQRVQTVFTAELIGSKQGLGNPSNVPIFILGMPRSGSTLVEQILASHPKVFGAGELDTFATAIASSLDSPPAPFPEVIAAVSGDQLHGLGTSYINAITALAPEAAHITDKMPANFRFVGLIHLALPHARIIHTCRDPVDTCLSCFSTLFATGQPFSYDLGELGRLYRAYHALMQHWRNVLPNGVMLDVQYEDVVDDLEGQTRRILSHCGLDWDDACLAFHKNRRPVRTASLSQVRQPIYRSSVGRWRPSRDLLQSLLEGLEIEPLAAKPPNQ